MRRALAPFACLFAALTVSAQTSQPISPPVSRSGPIRGPQQGVRSSAGNSFISDTVRMTADLKLSADQNIAFNAILELMQRDVAELKQKRAKEGEKKAEALILVRREIQAARRAGDRKRVIELKAKIDDIRAQGAAPDPYAMLFERIGAILTDEQKAQIPALREKYPTKPEPPKAALPNRSKVVSIVRRLDLTEEQKQSVTLIDEEYSQRMMAAPIFDKDEFQQFKLDFVNALDGLLTEEQRSRFQQLIGEDYFRSVPQDRVKRIATRPKFMFTTVKAMDLTDIQKKRVASVEKDFAARIRDRTPRDVQANRRLRQDLKAALGQILTNAQLERFEKAIETKRAEWADERRGLGGASSRPAGEAASKPKPEQPDKP